MDIRIGRFHAQYRMPAGREQESERLDRTLAGMFGAPLERALEMAGVGPDEDLCIRHLHVRLRIGLGATDASIEAAWTIAFARALEQARASEEQRSIDNRRVRPGDRRIEGEAGSRRRGDQQEEATHASGVVRYRSRQAALLDMALRVTRGDLSREWAWKQLGLWRQNATSHADGAMMLAEALLRESRSIASVLFALARMGMLEQLAALLGPEVWIALARAALFSTGHDAGFVLERLLELQRSGATNHIEMLLERVTWPGLIMVADTAADRPSPSEKKTALIALLLLGVDPGLRTLLSEASAPRSQETASERAEHHAPRSLEEPESLGATRFGGLLFLLNVLERAGLVTPFAGDPSLAGRTLRWRLHQLACRLVPVDVDDPAALAFAGLLPGDEPPEPGSAGPSAIETEALSHWIDVITSTLAKLLAPDHAVEPDNDRARLLDFVCRRPAMIDGDPGWIQATFPIESVSLDIRRAGLDVDPGWLPWLGCVVRFAYE